MCRRCRSTYLRFDVRTLNRAKLDTFFAALPLKCFWTVHKEESKNGWYACYAIRESDDDDDVSLDYVKVANILRVKPKDVVMAPVPYHVETCRDFLGLVHFPSTRIFYCASR